MVLFGDWPHFTCQGVKDGFWLTRQVMNYDINVTKINYNKKSTNRNILNKTYIPNHSVWYINILCTRFSENEIELNEFLKAQNIKLKQ